MTGASERRPGAGGGRPAGRPPNDSRDGPAERGGFGLAARGAWWSLVVGLTSGAHLLGHGPLAPPPWGRPSVVVAWWQRVGTLDATFALLRLLIVAIGGYLLTVGLLACVCRCTRWRSACRLFGAITTPGVRAMVIAAVGLSGIGSFAGMASATAANLASAPPAPSTSTLPAGSGGAPGAGPPILHFIGPPAPVLVPDPALSPVPTAPALGAQAPVTSPAATPGASPGPSAPRAGTPAAARPVPPPSPPSPPTTRVIPPIRPTTAIPPRATPAPHTGPAARSSSHTTGPTSGATGLSGVARPDTPASTSSRSGRGAEPTKRPKPIPPSSSPSPGTRPSGPATAPPGRPATRPPDVTPSSHTVQPGDSLWSIANSTLSSASGRAPAPAVLARYWWQVVAANRGQLPDPANPDLLFPGDLVHLPPLPSDVSTPPD